MPVLPLCFCLCLSLVLQMNGEDLPFAPPKKNDLYIVPTGIRPIMRRTAIEVSKLNEIT